MIFDGLSSNGDELKLEDMRFLDSWEVGAEKARTTRLTELEARSKRKPSRPSWEPRIYSFPNYLTKVEEDEEQCSLVFGVGGWASQRSSTVGPPHSVHSSWAQFLGPHGQVKPRRRPPMWVARLTSTPRGSASRALTPWREQRARSSGSLRSS